MSNRRRPSASRRTSGRPPGSGRSCARRGRCPKKIPTRSSRACTFAAKRNEWREPSMSENGNLPASELVAIPGGKLRKDAAIAWLAMRKEVGASGVWLCPTSMRMSYRSFADQQYFWQLYKSGRGPLAATPGTSNHGWGIAVDVPSPAMQAAVRQHGHKYGWGIKGGGLSSDAPSEAWHCTFHHGVYQAPDDDEPHVHPYRLMTDKEREARDVLVKQ